ncbi:LON peptidase substrate-binding domain-containing protein [Pseudahrensia aquimaris]|uniref:LON peptidase substrate-binding domain-containing protein n=1 Tax=Pseudahrensia aquimaris TaxID=744461 RepID=A0ABW3FKC2_9HYPH
MKAGNVTYTLVSEIPDIVPVFPLPAALLLPGGNMPLNIFEPRYLNMIDDAMRGSRIIGMIQPELDHDERLDAPPLCKVGCVGRITAMQESGDGRLMMNLSGICRFRLLEEVEGENGYRRARIAAFGDDLGDMSEAEKEVDRDALLAAFQQFLEVNQLEADWEGVSEASTETLVNSLSMMSPYGPAEKQALLEAPDLKTRAETLIAITEIALARESGDAATTLQ